MALILLGCVGAIAATSYAGFIWYVAQVEQPEYRSIKRARIEVQRVYEN